MLLKNTLLSSQTETALTLALTLSGATFVFLILLSAGFTVFGLFKVIRGQTVTQRSMGCDPPRYPPWGPGL